MLEVTYPNAGGTRDIPSHLASDLTYTWPPSSQFFSNKTYSYIYMIIYILTRNWLIKKATVILAHLSIRLQCCKKKQLIPSVCHKAQKYTNGYRAWSCTLLITRKPIIFRVFHACFEITCCLFSFCHMPPNRDYLVLKPEKFISKPWQDIVTEIQIWKLIWYNAGLCCQTFECSLLLYFTLKKMCVI